MDWQKKEKERRQAINAERHRLVNLSEEESFSLSVSERYQRIRYLREIEGEEAIRKNMSAVNSFTSDKTISHWTDKVN